jgi:ADP-ribose pyrophosphatase YjhB (NUDIX family)
MIDEEEVAALAMKYGAPARWQRSLDWSHTLDSGTHARWWRSTPRGRRGEIVLVMPRTCERVLVHYKSFYPNAAYRLMTGGVEFGERVEDAARREILEETGLDAALEKFLGIIAYEFRKEAARSQFVSYVFQTQETTAPPRVMDAGEEIAAFREVEWSELVRLADNLEQLPGDWYDWGRFRAIPHRMVSDLRSTVRG